MTNSELIRDNSLKGKLPISLPSNSAAALAISAIRDAAAECVSILDDRSKRIISLRFGLNGDDPKTLHAIGVEEGVTRERIRQVEQTILSLLRSDKRSSAEFSNTKKVQDALLSVVTLLGGIARKELLCELLGIKTKMDGAALDYLMKGLPGVTEVRESNKFKRYFRHREHVNTEKILAATREILGEKQNIIADTDLFEKVRERCVEKFSNEIIFSVLTIAPDLVRTPFGEWGMRGWVEATPRGVGDKAFVVLKRGGKPMHFLQITDLINEAKYDQRTAHPQTVHNELIRDGRFVLVGRGTYALKEWGYQSGTVGDVLERVIKNHARQLSKEELINEVLKERMVKRNTILLALQNRKRFTRDARGLYTTVSGSNEPEKVNVVEKQKQIINNDRMAVTPEIDVRPSDSKTEDSSGGRS